MKDIRVESNLLKLWDSLKQYLSDTFSQNSIDSFVWITKSALQSPLKSTTEL